jgi:hypothetical protein
MPRPNFKAQQSCRRYITVRTTPGINFKLSAMRSRSPSRGRTNSRSPTPNNRRKSRTLSRSRSPQRSVSPRSLSGSRTPSDRAAPPKRNGRARTASVSRSRSPGRDAPRYRERSYSHGPAEAPKSSKVCLDGLVRMQSTNHLSIFRL